MSYTNLYTRDEILLPPLPKAALTDAERIRMHCLRLLTTHPSIQFVIIDSKPVRQLEDEEVMVRAAMVPGAYLNALHYRPGVNDGVCERGREITFGLMWEDYVAWQVVRRLSA